MSVTRLGAPSGLGDGATVRFSGGRRSSKSVPSDRPVRWLLYLFVLGDVLPEALQLIFYGRLSPHQQYGVPGVVLPPLSGPAAKLQDLVWLVFILACLVTLLRRQSWIHGRQGGRDGLSVLLLGSLLLLAQFATLLGEGHFVPSRPDLVLLLLLLAVCVHGVSPSILRTLGHIAGWLGLCTLVFAACFRDAWIDPSVWQGSSKALVGHELLAGFYGQENTLGMAMAAAFPCVVYAFAGWKRCFAIAAVLLTVVLSASRTSMFAVGVVICVMLMARVLGPYRGRVAVAGISIIPVVATFAFPMFFQGSAFSSRGMIWSLAERSWGSSVLWGLGPYGFSRESSLSLWLQSALGYQIDHGHNEYVSMRTWLGCIGVLIFALVVVRVLIKCISIFPTYPLPLYVFISLGVLGILETPLRLDTILEQGWATWGGMIILACISSRPGGLGYRSASDSRGDRSSSVV